MTNEFLFCAGENPEKNAIVAFQTIKGDEKPLEGLSQLQCNYISAVKWYKKYVWSKLELL